jgi:adenine-specific DNA-methyltransferase
VLFTSIDDGEQSNLHNLQSAVFGASNFVSNIIWQKKYSPQNDAKWFSDNHDFITCVAKDKESWRPNLLPRTDEQNARYTNRDGDPRGSWKSADLSVKSYSANYDYPITTPSGRIVHPPRGRCWFTSRERMADLIADNRIWFGPNGDGTPSVKMFLSQVKDGFTPMTIWPYEEVGHNQEGKQELNSMLAEGDSTFGTPKVVRLLKRILNIGADDHSTILDFFAGSGTTGHAVINLNAEDCGSRKYILVEMGDYFDTVLKPRIQKVIYSKDWRDGKPVSREGSSHLLKYIRLESYEDTLNNLELKRTSEQSTLLEAHNTLREEYVLRYMLDVEARESASLLHIEAFTDPFNYKLNIANGGSGETRPAAIDLVETFNYLLGLRVQHVDNIRGFRVVQGRLAGGEKVLCIWRNTNEKSNADLDAFFQKQGYNTRDMEFDFIYVNGDNNLENLRHSDETWKVRLVEEEVHRLMFNL